MRIRHIASRGLLACALLIATLAIPGAAQAAPSPSDSSTVRLAGPTPSDSKLGTRRDAGTVLVKFKPHTSKAAQNDALEDSGAGGRRAAGTTGWSVVEVDDTPEAAVRELEADPRVADAALNFLRRTHAVPNDPALADGAQAYLNTMRFPLAWNVTKGTTAKTIAILDTGIDLDHPDLKARLKPGYNAVNPAATPNDGNGHGTFVAGVAGAITNNGRGIAGAAWNTSLMPVKVLRDNGVGTDADLIEGITWAADHGASVINLSLGGPGYSAPLHSAVRYAMNKNVVVVASAGNDARPEAIYPAAFGGVIAVTATDVDSTFAFFSNNGWWVDVAAPGMEIVSTYAGPGEQYAIGDGTSFAAPLVAGTALLVRTKFPTWTVGHINWHIRKTARDFGPSGFDPSYGAGVVDAYAAVGGAKRAPSNPVSGGAFEPNDTFDRASLITGSIQATTGIEGDVDWYMLDLPSTGSLTATVIPPAYVPTTYRALEMDPVLEIYSPTGALLGSVDQTFLGESETLTVPALTAGPYRIRVNNFFGSRSPSNYTLQVSSTVSGPSFNPSIARKYGDWDANHVAVADVTGDGRKDVLTTAGANLIVFVQQANGTLATSPVAYFASGMGPLTQDGHISVGDLNADGLNDVVLSTGSGIDIWVQTSGALGHFTHVATQVAGRSTAIADIDGDGDNEIVLGDTLGISYLNLTQAAWVETPIAVEPATEIEVADVNEDNLLDVIAIFGQQLKVYRQTAGLGTFQSALVYPVPAASLAAATGLEVLDVNRDGLNDVMVAGPDELRLYHQNAAGTFDAPVGNRAGGNSLDAADVDGDTVPDVGVAGSPSIYPGVSAGGLGNAWTGMDMTTINTPDSLVLADVSGDGLTDVITAGGASGVLIRTQFVPEDNGVPSWIRDQGPADFASGVSRTVHPTIEFFRELDPASIHGKTVAIINGDTMVAQSATLAYDEATRTITVTPSSTLLAGTAYIVALWHVRDLAGEFMHPFYAFRFKTA